MIWLKHMLFLPIGSKRTRFNHFWRPALLAEFVNLFLWFHCINESSTWRSTYKNQFLVSRNPVCSRKGPLLAIWGLYILYKEAKFLDKTAHIIMVCFLANYVKSLNHKNKSSTLKKLKISGKTKLANVYRAVQHVGICFMQQKRIKVIVCSFYISISLYLQNSCFLYLSHWND